MQSQTHFKLLNIYYILVIDWWGQHWLTVFSIIIKHSTMRGIFVVEANFLLYSNSINDLNFKTQSEWH